MRGVAVFLLAITVVGGYVLYVLRPDERTRLLAYVVQRLTFAAEAVRHHAPRRAAGAFDEALAARTRVPYVSALVLFVHAAIFALMLGGDGRLSDPDTLLRWGGSVGPVTANGEWWRLVTATFVHAGILHLLVDIAALAQTAVMVERVFGPITLAGVYLTSSMLASAIGLSGEPLAIATGAAAPIFALYGLLVALAVRGIVRRSALSLPRPVLRRLVPAAFVFVLYYMSMDGAQWTSGLASFVIGFAIGLPLTRGVAERKPSARRVLPLAATSLTMAIAIGAPLSGMTDARGEVARLFVVEDHTGARYRAATAQFTRGAIKGDVLAQLIERGIVPELEGARRQLQALPGVPRQQQALVSRADEFLRRRAESWTLRATALRQSNMRLLRDADQRERASLAILETLRPATDPAP